jgi:hypothetical protein
MNGCCAATFRKLGRSLYPCALVNAAERIYFKSLSLKKAAYGRDYGHGSRRVSSSRKLYPKPSPKGARSEA